MSDLCCGSRQEPPADVILETRQLSVSAGARRLLGDVNLRVGKHQVFGIIGPSGAGKSTLLRCLNRLSDLTPGLQRRGEVLLHGQSIDRQGLDVNALRAKVGMLFQQPVVFPTSIAENVLFGAKRLHSMRRAEQQALVEESLAEAALWGEVKDRLKTPALTLSIGQQQRLCLARTLAVKPEVILMDEPTSSLDPKSTQAIEALMERLKQRHTLVLVTHDIGQARRVTDWLACLCVRDGVGEVAESACCSELLANPQCREVVEYLEHAR